jgi:ubiquinone/menaquinone biosynthesis C-methylase UbiE
MPLAGPKTEQGFKMISESSREVLKDRLSSESSEQLNLFKFIKRSNFVDKATVSKVLDLGCGDGGSFEQLSAIFPNLDYHGVDIEQSPEVSRRKRTDLRFESYDGVNLPFGDDAFQMIFCKQVLEHVRFPDQLVEEVSRVLSPGGVFFGSVSQLEPYHSHSIFNWTAFGIVQVFESHNMDVIRLAPGIDGITLTLRRLFGREKFNAFFSNESLFNHYIEQHLKVGEKNHWERNYLKLVCAGHIIFAARKNQ